MGAIIAIVVAAVIGVGAAAGGSVMLVSAQPNRVGYVPASVSDSASPGAITTGSDTSLDPAGPNADIIQYGSHN